MLLYAVDHAFLQAGKSHWLNKIYVHRAMMGSNLRNQAVNTRAGQEADLLSWQKYGKFKK